LPNTAPVVLPDICLVGLVKPGGPCGLDEVVEEVPRGNNLVLSDKPDLGVNGMVIPDGLLGGVPGGVVTPVKELMS
jgi:hypothetical protein